MRKKLHSILLFLLITSISNAQVAITTDNTAPDNSAMLDVKSTSKGMLIPRMTTIQRNAILSPAKGLMVFCTDKNQLYINNGTSAAPIWSTNLSIPFSDSFQYDGALLDLTNDSTGGAAMFSITNPNSYWPAVYAETYGPGWTIQSYNHGATDGFAGYFRNTSPTNNWPAIQGKTAGTGSVFRAFQNLGPGPGMDVFMLYPTSTAPGIFVDQQGLGNAAQFIVNNPSNINHALYAETNRGTTIFANKTGGTENEAILAINSASGGFGMQSLITNDSNGWPSLTVGTAGTGNAGFFKINNSTNSNSAIYSETIGTGDGGFFLKNSPTGSTAALKGRSINSGGGAGVFEIFNASNFNASLYCVTQGTGSAGFFTVENPASTSASLFAQTNGTGTSLIANHTGSSGNIAIFQSSYANKARIDKTGKGFFNGGTQTGGADLAEMFDVEGPVKNYEPGDVMVISELSDRTMEKSSTAVSTKVAGVYATKPGVILTELGIDENLDALVPVGVIGVIPTKVCDQNGPIRRGDLLVTSSRPGHAMKAIPVDVKGVLIYPTGAILGKALENFETGKTGLIKVLVNVK